MPIWFLPGFKFDPTDKQLLECYLKAKVFGKKLPSDCIKEKEIYGPNANPWEVFNDSSTQWITGKREHEKVVYIFATLTKIAADKESSDVQGNEHNVRKAGCGIWHGETGRRPIMEGNNLIGHKRMLVFQINDINGLGDGVCLNKVGYWKMHEYFLPGYENYVVCRITFDGLKRAKVVKAVSGTRGSGTKSKANKKIARSICTTKDDRGEAVLIESSLNILKGSGKEVAPNYDSRIVDSNYTVEGGGDCGSGLSYENQRCPEENQLASMNSVRCYGFDQGLILDKGLPQYDDGSNFRVEEQECQGFAAYNDDQRLNYEEEAQPVIPASRDFGNQQGTVLSDFNSGPDDDVYLDLDDLFDGDIWSDINDVMHDDVSLNFGNLFDSEPEMEKFLGHVDNNVQEQQQQPMQNMSSMLGKRQSLEAQEDYSGRSKKFCI